MLCSRRCLRFVGGYFKWNWVCLIVINRDGREDMKFDDLLMGWGRVGLLCLLMAVMSLFTSDKWMALLFLALAGIFILIGYLGKKKE